MAFGYQYADWVDHGWVYEYAVIMTDQEIIIEVAKLDGWTCNNSTWFSPSGSSNACYKDDMTLIPDEDVLPRYLDSRDAIIPVIEKQGRHFSLADVLYETCRKNHEDRDMAFILSNARELCIALLKAKGKWKE